MAVELALMVAKLIAEGRIRLAEGTLISCNHAGWRLASLPATPATATAVHERARVGMRLP